MNNYKTIIIFIIIIVVVFGGGGEINDDNSFVWTLRANKSRQIVNSSK